MKAQYNALEGDKLKLVQNYMDGVRELLHENDRRAPSDAAQNWLRRLRVS
jgi:hypothetical protein